MAARGPTNWEEAITDLLEDYTSSLEQLVEAGIVQGQEGLFQFKNPYTGRYEVEFNAVPLEAEIGKAIEEERLQDAYERATELVESLGQYINAYVEARDEAEKPEYVLFEDPEGMFLGEKQGRGLFSKRKSRKMQRSMDKQQYAEASRKQEMDWYKQLLERRQKDVTKGAYGFEGSGTSRWAMTEMYQQAEQADKRELSLGERRAIQNWAGAKSLKPFWSNGLVA